MPQLRLIPWVVGKGTIFESQSCISAGRGDPGFMLFGPNDEELDPGTFTVRFQLALGRGPLPEQDVQVGHLEVIADGGQTLLALKPILRSELDKSLKTIALDFDVRQHCFLQYRVFAAGSAALIACKDVMVDERATAGQ